MNCFVDYRLLFIEMNLINTNDTVTALDRDKTQKSDGVMCFNSRCYARVRFLFGTSITIDDLIFEARNEKPFKFRRRNKKH